MFEGQTSAAQNAEKIKSNLKEINHTKSISPAKRRTTNSKDGVILEEKFQNYVAEMLKDDEKNENVRVS